MTQQKTDEQPSKGDGQREAAFVALFGERPDSNLDIQGRIDWELAHNGWEAGYNAGRAESNQQHSNDVIRVRREALAERTAEIVAQLATTADALMATGDGVGAGALRGVVAFLEVDVP